MTVYYAQQSSVNINAASVWYTTASGTGGSYLTWPPASDDVLMANGKTAITINVDTTVAEVRTDAANGSGQGGSFTIADGVILTANIYTGASGGSAVRLSAAAPAVAYIVGSIYGNSATGTVYGVWNTSTGTLNITGNVTAGNIQYGYGVVNETTGAVSITGTVTGGGHIESYGALNLTGTMTINGNTVGGLAGAGARNTSTGTLTITGSATGGSGASAFGAINVAAGTLAVGEAIGNGFGNGSTGLAACPGVSGSSTGTATVKSIRYGARGQTPTVGNVFVVPNNANQAILVKTDLTSITLARTDTGAYGVPSASDVRYGTIYALGNQTGACHVPTAAQVSAGVPVDNTIGTAVLTEANIRTAIGLASANLDSQLDALPTASENATAVWGAESRTLTESSGGGATAEDVWTYATRSLTEAPDVPTVEEIAAEVRTELTPELSRVANCATVESTGDQLAGLL